MIDFEPLRVFPGQSEYPSYTWGVVYRLLRRYEKILGVPASEHVLWPGTPSPQPIMQAIRLHKALNHE